MSREEANEKEKTEMSDKIRLEMALKESAEVAEKMMAKHSPAHASTSATDTPALTTDPWGAPLAAPENNVFDPFAETQKNSDLGFSGNAWGNKENPSDPVYAVPFKLNNTAPAPPAISAPSDPWSSSGFASNSSNAVNDPWNAPPASLTQPAQQSNQNVVLSSSSTQQQLTNDPWGSSQNSSALTAASDPWGGSPIISQSNDVKPTNEGFDPFTAQAFTPSQNFDPLKEFDQLTINPSAVHSTTSVPSQDLFSSEIMTPQSIEISQNPNLFPVAGDASYASDSNNKAGAFLGNNANLVNFDSLIAKPANTHQFITLNPTSSSVGANKNPFDQKGPSLSLNQMKSDNSNSFSSTPTLSSQPAMPGLYSSPTSFAPMGMSGTAPIPSNFGMAPGFQQNNINPFYTAPTQPTTMSQQSNQFLL